MIIPIRRAPGNNGAAEFMMIELNGELLRPQSLPVDGGGDNRKRRLEFGSVKFEKDGSPTLIIGNHQLKGTSISLKEPFVVMKKRRKTTDRDTCKDSESKIDAHSGVELQVAGIVKKKLMFDSYPKSIMR